jgi:hypothetical protein
MYSDDATPQSPDAAGDETTERIEQTDPSAALHDLIARLELDPAPRDEHYFQQPISAMIYAIRDAGGNVLEEAVAEEIAFSLHAHDHQDPSSWGLYFGPFMSSTTDSGVPWDAPALDSISPGVLSYWRKRAIESKHPVMRARYADLLWEMPKRLKIAKQDATMARVAIDAYLEGVVGQRYEHASFAVGKVKRALIIALSLHDDDRIVRARDALLALEDDLAADESFGLWGFSFDVLLGAPNGKIPLSDSISDKIVADLETRLASFSAQIGSEYHPRGAELAALRLASYYRKHERGDDVARVMRTYAKAVVAMRGAAPALLAAHSLEQLFDQLISFGLHDDARALGDLIRIAGEECLAEMKEVSTTLEIPKEEVEQYFATLLEGSIQEVHKDIAVEFLPIRKESENHLRELAKQAPLSYMISRAIKADDGRTVAHIGPLQSDLEGHLLNHISKEMQLGIPWLRELIIRGRDQGIFSAQSMLQFVLGSPVFPAKHKVVLEAGFTSYFAEDSISAIHVLVPQIEQGIRQLATLLGAPIYSQRRGGGLHYRALDDLLRSSAIGDFLGVDIVTYLRVLLTDARGWNVRNSVCHGLATASSLGMPVADRVVHALLLLSLVGQQEAH